MKKHLKAMKNKLNFLKTKTYNYIFEEKIKINEMINQGYANPNRILLFTTFVLLCFSWTNFFI